MFWNTGIHLKHQNTTVWTVPTAKTWKPVPFSDLPVLVCCYCSVWIPHPWYQYLQVLQLLHLLSPKHLALEPASCEAQLLYMSDALNVTVSPLRDAMNARHLSCSHLAKLHCAGALSPEIQKLLLKQKSSFSWNTTNKENYGLWQYFKSQIWHTNNRTDPKNY